MCLWFFKSNYVFKKTFWLNKKYKNVTESNFNNFKDIKFFVPLFKFFQKSSFFMTFLRSWNLFVENWNKLIWRSEYVAPLLKYPQKNLNRILEQCYLVRGMNRTTNTEAMLEKCIYPKKINQRIPLIHTQVFHIYVQKIKQGSASVRRSS